jgi:hypothetical protein
MRKLDEKLIHKLPDTFYDLLYSSMFEGKIHTPKSINNALREIDDILEYLCELKFPYSNLVTSKTGEVFFASFIKYKTLREHIIPVIERLIECRKLLLHKKYTKYDLYNYLLNTLYLVYKDPSENLEAWDSEEYVREDLRMKDTIDYFYNTKI